MSDYARQMLGDYLVTKQTGEKGILCSKVAKRLVFPHTFITAAELTHSRCCAFAASLQCPLHRCCSWSACT